MRLGPALLLAAVLSPAPHALDLSEPAVLSASRFVRFESRDGRPLDAIILAPASPTDPGTVAWVDPAGTLHAAPAGELDGLVAGGGSRSPLEPAATKAQLAVRWGKDQANRLIWDACTSVRFTLEDRGKTLVLDCLLVLPGSGPVTRPQLAVTWRKTNGRQSLTGSEVAPLTFGAETTLSLAQKELMVSLTLPAQGPGAP